MRMRWVEVWVVGVHVILDCILWYLELIDEDVTVIRKTGNRSGTPFLFVMGCFGVGIQKGMIEMNGLE